MSVLIPQQNTEDLAAMREMLVAMAVKKGTKEVIELLIGLLAQARTSNTQFKNRLEQALRLLYRRKSEKINPTQLSLLLQGHGGQLAEGAHPTTGEIDGNVPQTKESPKKLGYHKPRLELRTNLPREQKVTSEPAEGRMCIECGIEKVCIEHQKSVVLEFMPSHFKIIEQSPEKLACPKCESGVVTAPSEKVRKRGRPGPGLLANIMVENGQYGMPLYRQAQEYKRSGVSLPESTLGDWFGLGCDVMIPIADRESELMVTSNYVLGDDTGIKVLDRDHVNGVKRGHMWVFVS